MYFIYLIILFIVNKLFCSCGAHTYLKIWFIGAVTSGKETEHGVVIKETIRFISAVETLYNDILSQLFKIKF